MLKILGQRNTNCGEEKKKRADKGQNPEEDSRESSWGYVWHYTGPSLLPLLIE